MKRVFADSVYLIALVNPRDQHHEKAKSYICEGSSLVTTEFILTEVGDSLSHHYRRALFLKIIDSIGENTDFQVLPLQQELFRAALDLYRHRPDKDWSLTDCTSFVVMEREGLTDALTADHHFEQAGFNPLLK